MNMEQYLEWRKADPIARKARLMKGLVDPIVILAIWTGKESEGFIEGFVVASDTLAFRVGYVSLAWRCAAFDFTEGELVFSPTKSSSAAAENARMRTAIGSAVEDLSGLDDQLTGNHGLFLQSAIAKLQPYTELKTK